ncbi:hypothetical protein LguiA_007807 [Lonicera macranthoides]
MFPSEDGICPRNLFSFSHNACKFCNLPKELGMGPDKRLYSSCKTYKLARLSIAAGIIPDI